MKSSFPVYTLAVAWSQCLGSQQTSSLSQVSPRRTQVQEEAIQLRVRIAKQQAVMSGRKVTPH